MSSGRNYVKRGFGYLHRNGIYKTFIKGAERLHTDRMEKGYVPYHADEAELAAERARKFQRPYKFSILVPVYETDPVLFRKMLDSVGDQTYGNWELILADASRDDSRRSIVREFTEEYSISCKDDYGSVFDKVRYYRIEDNKGISANTNEALSRARGDYIALLDHDDLLENTALFDIMAAIESAEEEAGRSESISRTLVVYSDEDKVSADGLKYYEPNIKPGFDPVLLCTNNYICHFLVVDTTLAKSVGGFRIEYDGAQDHDFILRCTEGIRRDRIIHVPKVLYHWRSTGSSTSGNPGAKMYAYTAGKRAVEDAYKRAGISATVTDSPHLGFFDIEYERLHRSVIPIPFGEYTAMTARERDELDCEYIMFLSPELAAEDNEYIADMMSCMNLPHVGAVTGKIIGPDRRIESAGYDVSKEGEKTARFAGLRACYSGYMHRAVLHQLAGGFTDDCVLVRKDAILATDPTIRLKRGYDIYYMPKAVFRRKKK